METLNKKLLSFPFVSLAKLFASVSILFLLAACGNGGGGGSTPPPAPGVGLNGCVNCAGITQPLAISTFNSESLYMSQWPVQLSNMQLYVNGANYTPGVSSPYNLYDGPVAVQGTMNVTGAHAIKDSVGACAINPGSYVVQTYSAGSISLGTNFLVPELTAGHIRIRMSAAPYVSGSMLVNEGGAIRWKGRLEILSVGGQVCSNFFSDMK